MAGSHPIGHSDRSPKSSFAPFCWPQPNSFVGSPLASTPRGGPSVVARLIVNLDTTAVSYCVHSDGNLRLSVWYSIFDDEKLITIIKSVLHVALTQRIHE